MTGEAIRRVWLLCLPLALLAVFSALSSSPARAQSPADPQPQVVYQNLLDGGVLQQPAFGIQLCFASPINIKDLDKGGDFAFAITEPDGIGLGSRDVFQSDGYGITVYQGNPVGDAAGQWKFHYRVTSPDAQSALEGDINYTVDPAGSPVPRETPPPCVAPPASSGGGNDTLKYALLGVGLAGAAMIVLILFVVRRRRGQSTRRPTPGPTTPIDWSPSDAGATPPRISETRTPLPESSPPPSPATPPPVAQDGTPSPESSRPPLSEKPPEDSVAGESADYGPNNSRLALFAIAAAVILLIGLIIRRRGGRDRHRGRPGDDGGNDH